METKSALLNSRTARTVLGDVISAQSDVAHALGVIDRLGSLYDALALARDAKSPEETAEARAIRYEKQFKAAYARARDLASEAATRLDAYADLATATALHKAGLDAEPSHAAEIRAALRAMPPEAREAAVSEAFARGDAEILASIRGKNKVLWGGVDAPLDQMFDLHLNKVDPDRANRIAAANEATQALTLAADAFVSAAEKWRDPVAFARGEQQAAGFSAAEAALSQALNG
jgi:hypothetical protein